MPDDYTIVKNIEGLDTESRYLVHKAKEALEHAYAPYSKFQVGAALLLEDGTVVTGSNQENVSSPSGMCAERVALYAAASHHPSKVVLRIAITARRKAGKDLVPATPCGPCRQVIAEFENRQRKPIGVIMMDKSKQWVMTTSTAALLPFAFTPDMLSGGKE